MYRFLPTIDRDVVDKCIQHNSYCRRQENDLLSMMIDERKHIRELACRKIKVAREMIVVTLADLVIQEKQTQNSTLKQLTIIS